VSVDELFRAIESFFGHLTSIAWGALALALLCHLGRFAARSRAWRNVVAAAYPGVDVRWRVIFGGYVSGVAVNAIVPARGGDLLRLYVVKHRVEGATYPTLGATLLVETIFDSLVAGALLIWALQAGILPGLDVVPRLPSIDWFWLLSHPRAAAIVLVVALALAFVLGVWAAGHVEAFRRRVAQGLTILQQPRAYLRGVALWQAVDWAFRLATVFFMLRAFGVDADVGNTLAAQVAQSLATLVPLTPGGIGTEQALLVYVLAGEATRSALLSFSVGMKLSILALNLAVGFTAIFLLLRTLRWRDVLTREPTPEQPSA
jgi:uncharacterized membrane protein YbhN (UPF0104 family)